MLQAYYGQVNAADNLIREPSQDTIRVEVKKKEGSISIWNNGSGLPVQMHREHNCYVPELVFGQLLTSDNYDDEEKKVVGGRNGYGAKLTNIFSTKFVLETADARRVSERLGLIPQPGVARSTSRRLEIASWSRVAGLGEEHDRMSQACHQCQQR